jgi:hypothetical protein
MTLENEINLEGKWPFRCFTEKTSHGWYGVWIDLTDFEKGYADRLYQTEEDALKAAETASETTGGPKYRRKVADAELKTLRRDLFGDTRFIE